MKSFRGFFSTGQISFMHALKAFVCMFPLATLAPSVNADLVSHWSFDAGSGFSVTDSAGSNTGYLIGSPTWSTGILSGGMTFDGIDDTVVVYDDASLNPDRITVSAWVKSTATTIYTGIVDKWTDGYLLDFHTGSYPGVTEPLDGNARFCNDLLIWGPKINDGQWHLVTGTLGSTEAYGEKFTSLYVDGVQVGSVAGGGVTPTPQHDLHIGGDGASTLLLAGQIDDVGIWDDGLWAGEAVALYNVAVHPDLGYDLGQTQALFDVHRAYVGSTTVGSLTWNAGGSLGGNLGEVVKNGSVYSIRLDDNGNGLTTGTPSPTNPPEGPTRPPRPEVDLVSHWKLDDGSGTVADDSSGSHPGTLGGTSLVRTTLGTNDVFDFSAPTWTSGKLGGGLSFAGGPYNPVDFNAGDAVVVPLGEGDLQDTDISVSIWAKTTQNENWVGLVTRAWGHNIGDPGGWSIDTILDSGVAADVLSEGIEFHKTADTMIDDGQWHSIILTYWSEAQELRCYVDGNEPLLVEEASMGLTVKDIIFGGDAYSSVHYVGDLDDIGYWNGVLSDGEAKAIYTLAQEATLEYDLGQASELFEIAQAGSGEVTIGSLTWNYATGLSGGVGVVVKNGDDYFLQLDNQGNGVTTGVVPPQIPGDANHDGIVNSTDAAILADNWQTQTGANWGMGDFNADGAVNDLDAALLAANWQTSSQATVPEPGTLAMLASILAMLGITLSQRRRLSRRL